MGESYASLIVGVAFNPGDRLGEQIYSTLKSREDAQAKSKTKKVFTLDELSDPKKYTGITHRGKPFRIFEDQEVPITEYSYLLGYEAASTGRFDKDSTSGCPGYFEMTPELLIKAQALIGPAKAALRKLGQESLCDRVRTYIFVGHT